MKCRSDVKTMSFRSLYLKLKLNTGLTVCRKTCPRCDYIKEVSEEQLQVMTHDSLDDNVKKLATDTDVDPCVFTNLVICDQCRYVWCFICWAPWHWYMSCEDYNTATDKEFLNWSVSFQSNSLEEGGKVVNARQCTKCGVSIV